MQVLKWQLFHLLEGLVGQWLVLDLVVQVRDVSTVVLAPVHIQRCLDAENSST